MRELRLGVMGLSDGNGHPYSWSAIFNGYNPDVMKECPYPVIAEYLGKQKFPDDAIPGATVTHIWTQERAISEHVASASLIEYIVDDYKDMIGEVDGVLLARDDPENHYDMAKPFLEAGLPIYIDKPLATTVREAERIYALEQYEGQIFTCSAMGFAREFSRERLGNQSMRQVSAVVMKDWKKYGVHIIEPVLRLVGDQGQIESVSASESDGHRNVEVNWASGMKTLFTTTGLSTGKIEITVNSDTDTKILTFQDTYAAFKKALEEFTVAIRTHKSVSRDFVMKVVGVIEKGNQLV